MTNTADLGDRLTCHKRRTHIADRFDTDDRGPRSFHASPAEATQAPSERFLYLACLHEGTGVDEPDFIAVVDADPDSDSYGEVIAETPMPSRGTTIALSSAPPQAGRPLAHRDPETMTILDANG